MGAPELALLGIAHKARSWIAELAMRNGGGGAGESGKCCDLGVQDISGCGDGVVEQLGAGKAGPSVSPDLSPASRLAGWRRFSLPGALRCSTARSERYEDTEDSENQQYFSPRSEFSSRDISDTDSISASYSRMYSFRSVASSPIDSPLKTLELADATPPSRGGNLSQYSPSHPQNSRGGSDDVDSSFEDLHALNGEEIHGMQQLIDFESNDLIWYPPPPEDEGDDLENGFVEYDDDDDDNEVGDSSEGIFKNAYYGHDDGDDIVGVKGKHNMAHKEFLRNALHGHFRALVGQLLYGHGVEPGNGGTVDGWLDIVSSLAWQAASFVRPDTSKGGSMDPADYVKVKCLASGNPKDSTLVKGVVCSKNVKHKRMVSQHKNPRLLLLGGALEYQKVSNRLASINSVLEEEKEYLKNAVAKIEAQRPNVVMVEKTVPLCAQQLLAKEISLVLNVKKPLLERISRCTGAQIVSSIGNLPSARLGQCQMFRIERAVECLSSKNSSKNSVKTLMFFEGCPRRLGCTVLLRGTCREELKKVKPAVQFAVFAAYHLSLESSFLADEGATLPKIPSELPIILQERHIDGGDCASSSRWESFSKVQTIGDKHVGNGSCSIPAECLNASPKLLSADEALLGTNLEPRKCISANSANSDILSSPRSSLNNAYAEPPDVIVQQSNSLLCGKKHSTRNDSYHNIHQDEIVRVEPVLEKDWNHRSNEEHKWVAVYDHNEHYHEYISTSENPQSILVSLTIGCPLRGTVCKRSQLFRIKFYGNFDKPLGRYLHEDLFDRISCCPSCKEPAETHVRCYTHQQGSLTISVRNLASENLPGERDGKIWMWHRCLRCKQKDGMPPATNRVVMSDAARGLSFGKFLELSFSNHTTANRIACCGHSLQRDCLRFYGFGSMVAVFRYSPVHILSVSLPPSILDFAYQIPQEWIIKDASAVSKKKECFYMEIFDKLDCIERIVATHSGTTEAGMYKHIVDLKDLIKVERKKYDMLLGFASMENLQTLESAIDILELNRLRQELVHDACIWDRRLYMMETLTKENSHAAITDAQCYEKLPESNLKEWKDELSYKQENLYSSLEQAKTSSLIVGASSGKPILPGQQNCTSLAVLECSTNITGDVDFSLQSVEGFLGSDGPNSVSGQCQKQDEELLADEANETFLERSQSSASCLSDKIDLAWTGSNKSGNDPSKCAAETLSGRLASVMDIPSFQRAIAPARIKSFDSAMGFRNSFSPIDDPKANIQRAYSQRSPGALERKGTPLAPTAGNWLSRGVLDGGVRLLPLQNGSDVVVAIYDDEPSSMIAYALTTRQYCDLLAPVDHQTTSSTHVMHSVDQESSSGSCSDVSIWSYSSDQSQSSTGNNSKDIHFTVSFEDESSFSADKAKFSVTCYFAKQFDAIRKNCCPKELDYIRSLSRCKRWSAKGGKSNVYFAKTLDDRFIIKQVTRAELDSFEDFAPKYFKYLTESLTSRSPTCLAKVLGLYQIIGKNLRGGNEVKMDVMVMENLFFKRKVSRIYDLKGSLRSRYNPDTSGNNKVLLDLNLLETLHTKPIFLGSNAKRRLERAVWNDTSFLAAVDVMDYSLLVGIDEERKELVMGIIDYLRQYTWDKQLETLVKASGILGGPKNTPPTIISPVQYKKRFRKAMSKYFLTVPDQWSS